MSTIRTLSPSMPGTCFPLTPPGSVSGAARCCANTCTSSRSCWHRTSTGGSWSAPTVRLPPRRYAGSLPTQCCRSASVMRWSQLKQRVEANFAPRVRGRIELFQTRYRRAADSFGEVWVVVDGKQRYSWSDIKFIRAEAAGYRADDARMRDENRG